MPLTDFLSAVGSGYAVLAVAPLKSVPDCREEQPLKTSVLQTFCPEDWFKNV
jgi:hypothetical protein